MTSDLADLIARLERAEGPDCELDCAIYAFVFVAQDNPPPYTGSVDAALTLVPEGVEEVRLQINKEVGCSNATMDPDTFVGETVVGTANHPALALCIAALRAREAGNG